MFQGLNKKYRHFMMLVWAILNLDNLQQPFQEEKPKESNFGTELSKKATGKTLYILDEPTTGLHIADVHKLVDILQRLVDTGNTIVVIEHNLDLIKTCDHIIDLGPEGGERGGTIVQVGTPEQVVKNEKSYTGQFLKKYIE